MFVNVALNIPSDKLFTYEVPANLQKEVEIGKRAFVPFGRRKRTGFIGQFGKMMAEAITSKIRLCRVRKQPLSDVDAKPSVLPSPPLAASGIPDKKYLKALAKARKKEAKKIK